MTYNSRQAQVNWKTNKRWREQVSRSCLAQSRALRRLAKKYPNVYKRFLEEEKAIILKEKGPIQ